MSCNKVKTIEMNIKSLNYFKMKIFLKVSIENKQKIMNGIGK